MVLALYVLKNENKNENKQLTNVVNEFPHTIFDINGTKYTLVAIKLPPLGIGYEEEMRELEDKMRLLDKYTVDYGLLVI